MWLRTLVFALAVAPVAVCDGPDPVGQPMPCEENWTEEQWPERIDLFAWSGSDVYLVEYGCCDMFVEVYDLQCNYLCAPEGGLTGGGDGQCPDFLDEATYVDNVYAL